MHRLLYISTTRDPLPQAVLDQVLRVSRRNNALVGVTGLLIVGGRRFLQALEGPENAVRATYERIAKDPRHGAIVVLSDQPITERAFAGWAMGYQPSREIGRPGDIDRDVQRLVEPIEDATLRSYFTGFAQQHAA